MTMSQSQQSRRWCFTLNNPEEPPSFAHKYMIYNREVGESGTHHLQGFVVFDSNKRFSAVKKLLPTAHWEPAMTTVAAIHYCSKPHDGCTCEHCEKERLNPNSRGQDFEESGERPKTPKEIGSDNHARWTDVIRTAREGTIEDNYPKEFFVHNSMAMRLYNPDLPEISTIGGIWAVGPAGSGKSRWARQTYPEYYIKEINKWWDGYDHEDVVLMDDWSPEHKVTLHRLKTWVDHYKFRAQYKGGSFVIRPKMIVVTSQYELHELIDDPKLLDAIRRRFKIHRFPLSL